MLTKTILSTAMCATLGLISTLVLASVERSATLPLPQNESTDGQTVAETPDTKVSGLTPALRNLIDIIFLVKTNQDLKNPYSQLYFEVDQKYPNAIFESIKRIDTTLAINKNQVSKRYGNKHVWILGSAGETSSDENGQSLVVKDLEGTDTVTAHFPKQTQEGEDLANLKTGELTSLMCEVKGFESPSAQLDNCELFDVQSLKTFKPIRTQFLDALEAKGDLTKNAPYALMLLIVDNTMPAEVRSACAIGKIDCMQAYIQFPDGSPVDLEKVREKYRALGYKEKMLNDNPNTEKIFQEFSHFL